MEDTPKKKKRRRSARYPDPTDSMVTESDIVTAGRWLVREMLSGPEAVYFLVVEHANDGVVVIQDGLYKFVNRAWSRTTGYSVDELLRMSFLDVVVPEYREIVKERHEARMAGGEPPPIYRLQIRCKDGTIRDIEVSASVIGYKGRPADMAIIRDITEVQRLRAALSETEKHYEVMVEAAGRLGEGIGLFQDAEDREAVCIFANDELARILGRTHSGVIGQTISELFGPQSSERLMESQRRLQGGESPPPVYEFEGMTREGVAIPLEMSVGVTTFKGKPATVAFVRDISQKKGAEQVLERRIKMERLISRISSRLVDTADLNASINGSLADIGMATGADRAYLFLFRENGTIIDNTHEWCAEGVSAQIDSLQNVPSEAFQWWLRKMRDREVIHIPDVSKMPREAAAERQLVESQGIRSFVLVPVFIGAEMAGMIGLDNISESMPWSTDDLTILRMAGEIIGGVLGHERARQAEAEARALKEVARLRRELLIDVSHNILAPLTAIKGYATMLYDGGESMEWQAVSARLQSIIRASDRLDKTVETLLTQAAAPSAQKDLDRSG